MNYVTTNIRIPEDDYLRLKSEAAQKRTSFSAIIREKVTEKPKKRSTAEIKKILSDLETLAKKNAQKLKYFDSVAAIREMRDNSKW